MAIAARNVFHEIVIRRYPFYHSRVGGIRMHIRATGCLILGLAGLLSGTVEEVFAAEDLSEKNNLTVTRPTRPRFPDDVF